MQDETIPVMYNLESLRLPLTGVGHYTKCLLEELKARDDVAVQCFAGNRMVESVGKENEMAVPVRQRSLWRCAAGRAVWGMAKLRVVRDTAFWLSVGRRFRPGMLYHEPNHILKPFCGVALVTIHDLSTIHYPQYHPVERLRYFERELPRTLEQAAHILTVSEFSRQDIIKTLGVPAHRVSVTYNGVHARFRRITVERVAPVLAQWGLSYGRYLLSVGTLEPRKNLTTLVTAFERLPQKMRQRWPLALVGPKGWLYEAIENRLEQLERNGELVRIGYVSDDMLPMLYSGAAGFIFLSVYEGFGMPALEAAACGTPILTSIGTAMDEIVGTVAELVDPLDEVACTESLRRLLEDPAIGKRVNEEGPKVASLYTWSRTAADTVTAYRQVLSQG